MSTVRGVKDRRFKFVQLLNSMFEDPNISLKAKGFIGFCLTKKDDWNFHVSHLCSVLKEGETAIYSIITECIENGYAYRYQARGKDGRLLPGEFIISDSKTEIKTLKEEFESTEEFKKCLPKRENTDAVAPHHENRGTDFPGKNGGAIYSNTNNSNIREQQQQQPSLPAAAFSKPIANNLPASQVWPILKNIDIPDQDKIEISRSYRHEVVEQAVKWATHPKTVINKGLAAAIKWACKANPPIPQDKVTQEQKNKPYALKIDVSSYNKAYFRQISTVAGQNGHRLDLHGIKEWANDYLETDNDKIYYRDISFLEQIANFMRKKSIECPKIFGLIKACQQDLIKQTS